MMIATKEIYSCGIMEVEMNHKIWDDLVEGSLFAENEALLWRERDSRGQEVCWGLHDVFSYVAQSAGDDVLNFVMKLAPLCSSCFGDSIVDLEPIKVNHRLSGPHRVPLQWSTQAARQTEVVLEAFVELWEREGICRIGKA